MERINETINKIYLKYSVVAKKNGTTLDIDFPDVTLTVDNKERIEKALEKAIKDAIKRSRGGKITIAVRKGKITVSDDGKTLNKIDQEKMSSEFVKIKSRIGFGTSVTILD